MVVHFDSNHRTRGTDPSREQIEAPLGTTADVGYSGSRRYSDLIKELGRFSSERDIDTAVAVVTEAVSRLRRLSGP